MKKSNGVMEVFKIFQHSESYFEERSKSLSNRLIFHQILVICVFTFIYGMVMGSYHSLIQSLVAGLKVTFLFLCTLMICFPSFFVIQQVLGSKMSLRHMVVITLSGFVLTSAIALSFAPIIVFFQITGGNYHFLQLLHVAIFVFSGIFGMRLMIEALKYACEKKGTYPQIGVTVFRIWIIILAFVGIQLSWNLRPSCAIRTKNSNYSGPTKEFLHRHCLFGAADHRNKEFTGTGAPQGFENSADSSGKLQADSNAIIEHLKDSLWKKK
ncbi:MAG: hypothetical protein IPN08_17320 [Bacteroidales bacterium]|nr:hypothetical protein [Bacteroidales bacterium]